MRQKCRQDREENRRLIGLTIEESRKNTERMLKVFNQDFDMVQPRIDRIDEQLE